jgi:anti-sigma B factor antagonist
VRPLQLASSHDDGTVRVRIEGELDLTTAQEVEQYLMTLEREHQPQTVVLDLSGLRFLDSTGLRLILATDSRARREGRRLQIVPGPEAVHRVFRIALLDGRLEFVEGPPRVADA